MPLAIHCGQSVNDGRLEWYCQLNSRVPPAHVNACDGQSLATMEWIMVWQESATPLAQLKAAGVPGSLHSQPFWEGCQHEFCNRVHVPIDWIWLISNQLLQLPFQLLAALTQRCQMLLMTQRCEPCCEITASLPQGQRVPLAQQGRQIAAELRLTATLGF